MNIGIFDSGIGGITVLHEAMKIMPEEDYIYYADTEHVPYGTKSKELVKGYVIEAVEFLVYKGAQAIVIACNTATSVAIEALRDKFDIPILGMEPAVKPAVEKNISTSKRVLVTATPLTIKEEKLKNLITRVDNEAIVDLMALPGLVDFAESLCFDENIVSEYLLKALEPFDLKNYGTIVLGCTHFPYYKEIFKKLLPKDTDIIDGSYGTVKHLKNRILDLKNYSSGNGKVEFYSSGKKVEEKSDVDKFEFLLHYLNRN